jgi:hypothetical protein
VSSPQPLPYRDEFEKHGETGTRFKFAGKPGELGRAADVWLTEMDTLRAEAAALKRDAREEETLSIARKALAASEQANSLSTSARSDARLANRIAITAAILAALATIIAAVIGVMYGPK